MADQLSEPLLQELPPSSQGDGSVADPVQAYARYVAAANAAAASRRRAAPQAWVEYTDDNGRGLAALTAFLLGFACASAVAAPLILPSAAPFFCYLFLLCLFHVSEYLLTAAFRPDTLSFDNFLINHSTAYQAMVGLAWAEYWIEWVLVTQFGCCAWWPGGKSWDALSTLGVLLCLLGLCTRSLGMATASTNFSHKIEEQKREEHSLVTHGIYAYLRHPAYFGFFWWCVGTQVLLANPFALLAYTAASWHFFYDRIPTEELLLVEFFGDAYRQYRKKTMLGIPLLAWAVQHMDN